MRIAREARLRGSVPIEDRDRAWLKAKEREARLRGTVPIGDRDRVHMPEGGLSPIGVYPRLKHRSEAKEIKKSTGLRKGRRSGAKEIKKSSGLRKGCRSGAKEIKKSSGFQKRTSVRSKRIPEKYRSAGRASATEKKKLHMTARNLLSLAFLPHF